MPFLKKVKLYGFKSFAFKTEFEFKGGVVCIVGPNGCGKSNIVDALKWGFGEKNIKSIRGDSSVDTIFAGTEVHKPMGFAEVEIVIDNSDMSLPLKYNEISIKRRVYRSGETEFFINKNKVRLKDIHDLLADTGIGKGAYSFMEQGKIDMILSSKPEDRRLIFEEAAGIARYKARKKETLSKLDATNSNLSQVNVLLKELESERTSLKKQAEKAKIYNNSKDDLKELEILLYGSRYKKNVEKTGEMDNKIKLLKDKKTKLKTENSSLNSEIEKIKNQIFKFNQTKNKFEKDKLTYEQIINSHNDKIDIFNDLKNKNNKDIQLKKDQIKNIVNENIKNETSIKSLKAELEKFKSEQKENEILLIDINDQKDDLKEKKTINFQEKEKLKNVIEENTREIEELRVHLRKVTDDFVAQIDKKKKEVLGKQSGHFNLKAQLDEQIDKIKDQLEEILNKKGKAGADLKDIISQLKVLRKLIQDLTASQDEFRDLIFDEKGPYAKKEKIDQKINDMMQTIISNQNKISTIESENEKISKQVSDLTDKYNELDMVKNDLKHYINNHNKDIHAIHDSIKRNNTYLKNLESEIGKIEDDNNGLTSEIKKMSDDIDKYASKCEEIDKKILKYEEDM
ncbi:MAG: AAA family ATPase, partial [Spirochaetes bacterium]|nr:AAA family ATPase [Spirochaetota bacterium]